MTPGAKDAIKNVIVIIIEWLKYVHELLWLYS